MEKRTDFYDFIDKVQRQDKYIEYIEEEIRKICITLQKILEIFVLECKKFGNTEFVY